MNTLPSLLLCLAIAALALPAAAAASLEPYRSEAELTAALDRWRAAAQALQQRSRREAHAQMGSSPIASPAPMMASKAAADSAAPATAAASESSITNVQTAGVDEGGIVKRAGEYLVVLRRGRLFTVRIGGDQLQPAGMADAFAPGSDPRGAWYDELLVHGNTLVVVGYSYARGGTEIGLFDLAADGGISHRSTHHLRSNDYYSARNYASRLVGNQLVFYSPTLLSPWAAQWAPLMPAARRWGAVPEEFQRILPATRIHRSDDEFDPREPLALHTITRCELGRGAELPCESSAVLGPAGRVFYVSASAVVVWAAGRGVDSGGAAATVFRLPLDGATPAALKAVGMPTDQFSFHEDQQGQLNVLLREAGRGEAMAGPTAGSGRTALLRVPLSAFGDGRSAAQREHYQRLPGPEGAGALQNRFIGDWLVWGAGDAAWATRYARPAASSALRPGHDVERIEALGEHALLVGRGSGGLVFSSLRLGASARGAARLEGQIAHPGAQQGETRSHGFFYRASGSDEGLLGLPVRKAGAGYGGRGREGSAAVVVLRQRDLGFTALGELAAGTTPRGNDRCQASCVDWYGNARPIFIGERVLALLGYEIVEGRVRRGWAGEAIDELRRIDFGPRPRLLPGNRPTPFDCAAAQRTTLTRRRVCQPPT
jgi:Beta propeller domain